MKVFIKKTDNHFLNSLEALGFTQDAITDMEDGGNYTDYHKVLSEDITLYMLVSRNDYDVITYFEASILDSYDPDDCHVDEGNRINVPIATLQDLLKLEELFTTTSVEEPETA